jgi:hypothetical protein
MRVELTYFEETGKYYSDGEYITNCLDWNNIQNEIGRMIGEGDRPGLVHCAPGTNEFYVLVNIPDHKYNVPKLIIP